jgi:hypothetical protein
MVRPPSHSWEPDAQEADARGPDAGGDATSRTSSDPSDSSTTFDATHYDKAYPDGIERHYWHRARNIVIARALRREGLGAGARLLEIGCGRGLVTAALRDVGFDCHGVELADAIPPPRVAPYVRTKTSFEDLPPAVRREVRGALLLDVLEHIEDPIDFLERIRSALPSLEVLLLTVPARRELWSRWDEFYGHRCRYDRPSLEGELTRARYAVHVCEYFFHGLYPAALAINALGRARSTDVVAPPESLIHRAVGRWFALESAALPGFVPGTSLIAAARPTR